MPVVHLPEQAEDGRGTVRLVEQAGREAVAVPGDLTDEAFCVAVVKRAVDELGGWTCW